MNGLIGTNSIFTSLPTLISLVVQTPEHEKFLFTLYACSRKDEMVQANLSSTEQRKFLKSQHQLRNQHYLKTYPNAQYFVLIKKKKPIGRLVIEVADVLRLIDVAIIEKEQGKGLGSSLINDLLCYAKTKVIDTRLSVAIENQKAFALYQRLGFQLVTQQGNYYQLERKNDVF